MTTTPLETTTPPPPASMSSSSLNGGFSRHEIEAFRRFVSQLDHPSNVRSTSFAYSGTSASALPISISNPQSSKIIDSRASHHMTGVSSFFSSYKVSSGKDKVRIVDGSFRL